MNFSFNRCLMTAVRKTPSKPAHRSRRIWHHRRRPDLQSDLAIRLLDDGTQRHRKHRNRRAVLQHGNDESSPHGSNGHWHPPQPPPEEKVQAGRRAPPPPPTLFKVGFRNGNRHFSMPPKGSESQAMMDIKVFTSKPTRIEQALQQVSRAEARRRYSGLVSELPVPGEPALPSSQPTASVDTAHTEKPHPAESSIQHIFVGLDVNSLIAGEPLNSDPGHHHANTDHSNTDHAHTDHIPPHDHQADPATGHTQGPGVGNTTDHDHAHLVLTGNGKILVVGHMPATDPAHGKNMEEHDNLTVSGNGHFANGHSIANVTGHAAEHEHGHTVDGHGTKHADTSQTLGPDYHQLAGSDYPPHPDSSGHTDIANIQLKNTDNGLASSTRHTHIADNSKPTTSHTHSGGQMHVTDTASYTSGSQVSPTQKSQMLTSLSQNQGAAVGNKDPNANPQGATGNVEEKFMMMFDSWFHERFGTKGTAVAEESKPLPAAPSPAAHPVTNQPWQSSATYHVTSGNAQNTQRPLFVIRQETSVGLGHPIQLKPVLPNPKAVIKPTFDIRDLILQPSPGVPLPPTKPNDVTTSTARPADGNVDKNTLFKEFMTMFKSELKGNSVVDASAQSATPAPSHYVTQQHVYSASPIPSPPVPAANPASFVVPPKPAPVFVPPKPAPVFVTPKPALVYIPATPIPPPVPAATHAPFVVPLKSVPIIITSTPVPPTVRRDEPVPVPRPNKPIPETRPKESHSESGGSGEARVSGERNQGRREGQQDHHSENQVLTRPAPTSRPQSTKSAPVSISMTHHVRENRPSRPRTPAPAPSPNRGSPPPTKPHVDKAVAAAEAVVQQPSLAVNTSVETPAPTTLAPTTAVPTIDPDLLSDINEARSYQGLPPLLPHQVDLAGNIKPRFQQRQQRLNLFPGRRHPLRDAAGHHEMFHRQVGPAMSPEVHQAIHVILSNTRPNLYGGFGGPATSNPGLAFNPAMDPDLMADIMEARGATGIHTPLY